MGSGTPNRARALGILGLGVAFAPALACALLVARHAVDVPVWDDWERAKLLARGLDWAYLYSPHIDHRILVPRLVALANAHLFGGDLRLEMGLSVVVVLVTALGVFVLLRRSLGDARPGSLYATAFLANALLFSPLQWENLLWAAQPFFLWPMAAVVLALVLLGSGLRPGLKLALALALAAITTHTFSHGLALWVLVPVAVLFQRGDASARTRAVFVAVWLVAGAAFLVPYFTVDGMRSSSEASHAFDMPPGERAPGLSLAGITHDPVKTARFAATMLGSPFARMAGAAPRNVAAPLGVGVALLFALGAGAWLLRGRDADAWNRGLPWVLLGGYGLGLCALAALGRAPIMRWSYALLPHYVSIAIYPMLAALPLALLFLAPPSRAWPVGPFATGLLTVAIAVGWIAGVHGMDEWRSARLQARTALLYQSHFRPRLIRRLDGSREVVARFAPVLDRHGQLRPPLQREATLDGFAAEGTPLPDYAARVHGAWLQGQNLRVEGHAWLPDAMRRADGVLFVVQQPDGSGRVVALGELRGFPWFHVAVHDHIFDELSIPGPSVRGAFAARISGTQLPEADHFEVEVWAVDAERMRLHPFVERLIVERGPEGARVRRAFPDRGRTP